MAATTISRASLTDGVTVWNAATVGSAIYDKVDALLAGAVTVGGLLGAEGFGTHLLSAGGTGEQAIQIRNTTAGTGNFARFIARADSTATVDLVQFSTTFTTAGYNHQNGARLLAAGSGGLSIATSDAAGTVRVYTAGSNLRTTWGAEGGLTHAHGLVMTGTTDRTLSSSTTITDLTNADWVVRITSGAATPKLSAISPVDGQTYFVVNASGADFDIEHEYTGASATSRIYCPNSANVTMKPHDCALLWYDNTTARWRVLARGL